MTPGVSPYDLRCRTARSQAPGAWLPALPGRCTLCRGWGRGPLCLDCSSRFASDRRPRCPRCALPLADAAIACGACLRSPPPFDACVTAVDYAYPWDALLARMKFAAALEFAPLLASLLIDALRLKDDAPPDIVVPVPLALPRLRERGYNQAWEIARRVSARARARVLLRTKDTPRQTSLPRAQRLTNVRHAFAVEPAELPELQGARVALVDDVMTTGATVDAAARTLIAAGAACVHVWVVARTPSGGGR